VSIALTYDPAQCSTLSLKPLPAASLRRDRLRLKKTGALDFAFFPAKFRFRAGVFTKTWSWPLRPDFQSKLARLKRANARDRGQCWKRQLRHRRRGHAAAVRTVAKLPSALAANRKKSLCAPPVSLEFRSPWIKFARCPLLAAIAVPLPDRSRGFASHLHHGYRQNGGRFFKMAGSASIWSLRQRRRHDPPQHGDTLAFVTPMRLLRLRYCKRRSGSDRANVQLHQHRRRHSTNDAFWFSPTGSRRARIKRGSKAHRDFTAR